MDDLTARGARVAKEVFSARLLAIEREMLPADPFFVQFNDGEPEPVLLIPTLYELRSAARQNRDLAA